ncbi:MAG: CO dehydrogenase/CO-methylating acetyl-CoA synthase complex subunit beta [Deltaproteobacteria bacterium]|nr:CO dehydrogenase/CO-methylating acetyl-CoA synthase complex subunit beta [Deltaproteobacteria bacterium]
MSKIIASAGIRGAHTIVERAEKKYAELLEKHGPDQEVAFPNTAYFLPVIYGMLGIKVEKLADLKEVFGRCRALLPPFVKEKHHLPYLAPALDAGMVAFFAQEMEEAMRYIEHPDFYQLGEDPTEEKLWLGAADDVILRKRGVEFVDGTAPGFAAILGAPPTTDLAVKLALELQEKNLYVFMHADTEGRHMAEQLKEAGVQVGWPTRLVPFGPTTSSAVFAAGFATRAAMSFGGLEPGDFRKILIYNKDRIFAFALTFGQVSEEWYANGLGCVNYGFPVIADTPIPEVLPTGICTYEHVVANIPYDNIVAKAIEVRGLKVTITEVPVPVPYGPAFEGERVRGENIRLEAGGPKADTVVEWTTSKPMDEVEDGKVEVIGPELDEMEEGARIGMAVVVEVAGRGMQADFEPILERQIHHLVNYAKGVMHIGQRDIAWYRIGKDAFDKGFRFKHLGSILHAKYHQEFGGIVDKVQVKIYTDKEKVPEILKQARAVYAVRDARVEGMTDEEESIFYSCTLCQSFAPSHVCVVTPERTGLCGAYSWLDCKAAFEISPTGPNQPIEKGTAIDEFRGQWEGTNAFVKQASRGAVEFTNAYSIMDNPMTSCGCFECIAAIAPSCNGIMVVDRDYGGMTPCGMKFTTLAGTVGGGAVTPGFVGHSKSYISSKKFIRAEGGIKRVVWLPKHLKEEIKAKFEKRAADEGIPDLLDRIADESVGTTEEEILPFLTEKEHPALSMDSIM